MCECTVHSECIGEKAEVALENSDDNDVWICPVCKINKELGDEGY